MAARSELVSQNGPMSDTRECVGLLQHTTDSLSAWRITTCGSVPPSRGVKKRLRGGGWNGIAASIQVLLLPVVCAACFTPTAALLCVLVIWQLLPIAKGGAVHLTRKCDTRSFILGWVGDRGGVTFVSTKSFSTFYPVRLVLLLHSPAAATWPECLRPTIE
jgi:hypothetical protein